MPTRQRLSNIQLGYVAATMSAAFEVVAKLQGVVCNFIKEDEGYDANLERIFKEGAFLAQVAALHAELAGSENRKTVRIPSASGMGRDMTALASEAKVALEKKLPKRSPAFGFQALGVMLIMVILIFVLREIFVRMGRAALDAGKAVEAFPME